MRNKLLESLPWKAINRYLISLTRLFLYLDYLREQCTEQNIIQKAMPMSRLTNKIIVLILYLLYFWEMRVCYIWLIHVLIMWWSFIISIYFRGVKPGAQTGFRFKNSVFWRFSSCFDKKWSKLWESMNCGPETDLVLTPLISMANRNANESL
jgi:hypothetical protein